jgi:hypothetical protein
MDKQIPWLSDLYDSDLAADDEVAAEPENQPDDEDSFWDNMIFPI